ncbi:MAG TPA: hypothetical protein PLH37_03540 [bacterium]|nr:hypothetical protein [bacterium]
MFKRLFSKIIFSLLCCGLVLVPSFASAGALDDAITNLGTFVGKAGLPGDASVTPINIVIGLINYLLGFLGLFFVILIIYAGFTWMTAMGEATKIKKAKDTITNSIYGVIIIVLAYVVANIVIKEVLKIVS